MDSLSDKVNTEIGCLREEREIGDEYAETRCRHTKARAMAEIKGEKPPEAASTSCLLIPGLPNEIALAILVRLPHLLQARLRVVCRSWKHAMEPAAMRSMRKMLRIPEVWLVAWGFSIERTLLFKLVDRLHARIYSIYWPPQLSSFCFFLELNHFSVVGHEVLIAVEAKPGAPREACEMQGLYSFDVALMKWYDAKYSCLPSDARGCALDMEGGYAYAAKRVVCDAVMRLDLKTKLWEVLPNLHVKRRNFDGVMLQRRLCIVGGIDQHFQGCTSGEIWDPINQEWTLVPELWPFDRHYPMSTVAVVMDRLYALHVSCLSMELMHYEASSKVWMPLGNIPVSDDSHSHLVFGVFRKTLFGMHEELWVIDWDCPTIWITKPSDSQPLSWRSLSSSLTLDMRNIYVGAMLV